MSGLPKIEIVKRDGRRRPFLRKKLAASIGSAGGGLCGENAAVADELSGVVESLLRDGEAEPVKTSSLSEIVEQLLADTGYASWASSYREFSVEREKQRSRLLLRLASGSDEAAPSPQDAGVKAVLTRVLLRETGLSDELASNVAGAVERRLFRSKLRRVSLTLLRELADSELLDRGYRVALRRNALIGVPVSVVRRRVDARSGMIHPARFQADLGGRLMAQYALDHLYTPACVDAHLAAQIHLGRVEKVPFFYAATLDPRLALSASRRQPHDGLFRAMDVVLRLKAAVDKGLAAISGFLGLPGLGWCLGQQRLAEDPKSLAAAVGQGVFSRRHEKTELVWGLCHGAPWNLERSGAVFGQWVAEFQEALLEYFLDRGSSPIVRLFAAKEPPPRLLALLASLAQRGHDVAQLRGEGPQMCHRHLAVDPGGLQDAPGGEPLCRVVFGVVWVNLPRIALECGPGDFETYKKHLRERLDLAVQSLHRRRNLQRSLMAQPELPLWRISGMMGMAELIDGVGVVSLCGLERAVLLITGELLGENRSALDLAGKIVKLAARQIRLAGKRWKIAARLEPVENATAAARFTSADRRLDKLAAVEHYRAQWPGPVAQSGLLGKALVFCPEKVVPEFG